MKPQLSKEERDELERFIREFPFTKTARAIKSAVDENNTLKSQVEEYEKTMTLDMVHSLLEENQQLRQQRDQVMQDWKESMDTSQILIETVERITKENERMTKEIWDLESRLERYSTEQGNDLRRVLLGTNLEDENQQLREELKQVKKERDKALAYPTIDAYEAACKALEKHRTAAESLRSELATKDKVLEWYADEAEEEARKFHFGVIASNIGELARQTLQQVKGDT